MTSTRRADRFAGLVGGPARGCDAAPGHGDDDAIGRARRGTIEVSWTGRPRPAGATGDDARLGDALLDAWARDGDDVAAGLAGDFLVAFRDLASGEAVVAVDRFSTYPLFWTTTPGGAAYGPTPARVLELAGRGATLDPQAVLAYVYFHVIPSPMSIFRDVGRLENGCALHVRGGRAQVRRYWTPRFDESRPFDFRTERDAFLAALRDGVRHTTDGVDRERLGCFLSGGTDSSTIAGLATERYGAPARTFSIAFDVSGYDESGYSRLAARHFGTDHTEHVLTADDVVDGLRRIATTYEQPFGNSSAVPTYVCARMARERGIERMLGGDGGDELYGGNERYAKQAVFGLYARVPAPLRRALLEPLLSASAGLVERGPVAKARSYVEQANQPLPDRLQARYNLLNFLGAGNVFTAEFLGQVDLGGPLALEREVWARCEAPSQLNRLLAYDFKFTLADNDLPKVTRMCMAAGVDVAFPMLEAAVVDHSLGVPPGEKLKGRSLRHFFRESLRGFLPDAIIDKSKHGFGMPFGEWVMTHATLRAIAEDALGSLSGRGIVREAFLAELRQRLGSGHAGYYGTMVWVLTVLELWLRESPAADVRV